MSFETKVEPLEYEGGVIHPGESEKFQFPVTETYLGDPLEIPVTIVNGAQPGPTCFLSAASHGDELNGIEVVREVTDEWDHEDIHGCLIGLPVLNVPGFLFQERYLPIYDRDLNRAFPGDPESTSAKRIANAIFRNFIEPCDFGIDFHTSTRGRTNMFHVRADMENESVAALARGFGSNVIIADRGTEGTLRRAATDEAIPTITIEMGEAHRFQRVLIDRALDGVRSVMAQTRLHPQRSVQWPGWQTVIEGWGERTWLRADEGGLVDMRFDRGDLVLEGEEICTISTPFRRETETVRAPFTGLLVGVLENPVVYPGNPLCHFVELEEKERSIIESSQDESE
ncbi:MAG: succinylglutamate desuccinylase/aspartoacylase family protein [Halodesulfurarchaeum sp.]